MDVFFVFLLDVDFDCVLLVFQRLDLGNTGDLPKFFQDTLRVQMLERGIQGLHELGPRGCRLLGGRQGGHGAITLGIVVRRSDTEIGRRIEIFPTRWVPGWRQDCHCVGRNDHVFVLVVDLVVVVQDSKDGLPPIFFLVVLSIATLHGHGKFQQLSASTTMKTTVVFFIRSRSHVFFHKSRRHFLDSHSHHGSKMRSIAGVKTEGIVGGFQGVFPNLNLFVQELRRRRWCTSSRSRSRSRW